MAEDLYSLWLKVPPGARPPDHYALLGLSRSADRATIESQVQARLDVLDRYALHPDPTKRDACQKMMNEVARARVVLSDPQKRAAYDLTLPPGPNPRRAAPSTPSHTPAHDDTVDTPATPETTSNWAKRVAAYAMVEPILWIAPLAALIIGGVVLFFWHQSRSNMQPGSVAENDTPAVPASKPVARIDKIPAPPATTQVAHADKIPELSPEEAVRAAAITAADVMAGEDFEALKASITADETAFQLWQLVMEQRLAMREFREAIIKRFGDGGATYAARLANVAPGERPWSEIGWRDSVSNAKLIKTAKIKIDGDDAFVLLRIVQGVPLWRPFKKMDGRWKQVDDRHLPPGVKPDTLIHSRQVDIEKIRQLAKNVSDGRFATLDAMDAAFWEFRYGGSTKLRRSPIASNGLPADAQIGITSANPDIDPDDKSPNEIAVGPAFGNGAGLSNKQSSKSDFDSALGQLAYERDMATVAADLPRALHLNDAQVAKLTATEKKYRDEASALQTRRADEYYAAAQAVRDVQLQIQKAGGNANPDLLRQVLEKHEPLYRETADVIRRYRLAVSQVLTPDQRLQWQVIPVRKQMWTKLNGVPLSPQQSQKFDAAVKEAATKILALPEPRERDEVDRIIADVWLRLSRGFVPPSR
jgi:hypothetical protein